MGNRVLLLFLMLLAMPGCGYLDRFSRSSPEVTEVKFFSRAAQSSNLDGGVMVYALRADGFTQSVRLQNRSDSASMTLPNGSYRFRFVGYSAANLGGVMYCGFRGSPISADQEEPVILAGQAMTISAELSTSRCDSAAFRPLDGNIDEAGGLPVQAVFCSSFANTSGKLPSLVCNNGDESHRFFKGRLDGKAKPQGIDIPRSRLIFTSDHIADSNGRFTTDLYSVGFDGTGMRREVPRINSTGVGLLRGVKSADVPRGRSLIVYTADGEDLGDLEMQNIEHLYIKQPNLANPIRLSPLRNASYRFRVPQFQFSPDGRWLAYVVVVCNPTGACDYSSYLLAKLYVVDLDNPSLTPVEVSPAYTTSPGTPWGKGLPFDNCSGCKEPFKIKFNRLADGSSSRIAFAGSFANEKHLSPISTNLVGAPVPVIHAQGSTGSMFFEGQQFAWNHNGTKLLFTGGEGATFGPEFQYSLFAWEIGVSGVGQNIGVNGTHPIGTKGVKGWVRFYPSPTEDKVFYLRDRSGFNEAGSLYVSDFSDLANPLITRVFENNDTANWNTEKVEDAKWSPDGQKIIFFSNHETNNSSDFYAYIRLLSNAADTIHKVNPGTGSTGAVLRSGDIDGDPIYIGNNLATFAAKISGTASVPYVVDLTGATPTAQSAWGGTPPNANMDVKSLYLDGVLDAIVFAADDATDGIYRPFVKNGSSAGGQTALPMPTNLLTASSVFLPGREFNSNALGRGLLLSGRNVGAGANGNDLWFLKDYAAPVSDTNPLAKLSRSWHGNTTGAGRFRMGLLNFKRQGGQIGEMSVAMETPCFDYNVSGPNDGDAFNTGRRFPVGAGDGSSPFVSFVDVFTDESYSCSGPFQRLIFPNGLAAGVAGEASGYLYDFGGAVGANFFKVFVKDP